MHGRTAHRAAKIKAPRTDSMRRRVAGSARGSVRHVTLPFAVTDTAPPRPNERIAAFLARTALGGAAPLGNRFTFALPTICVVNGEPVPQREWKRRRIRNTDHVEFWSRPWGGASGGGSNTAKQIGGIVALVALAAFAPWALGPAGLALFEAGSLGLALASGAIVAGGGLLLAALTKPAAGGTSADKTKDQVEQLYSVAAQGNTARLLQPLEVQYGRIKGFKDFAITPWTEFSGNDAYLNVLLSVGLGKYSAEALYIDDTILWTQASGLSTAFTGVSIAFYDPNTPVTLFPTNVTQSSSVSGQDITQTPIGGFIANAAGSLANAIAVDVVFPGGCYSVNPNNTQSNALLSSSVTVRTEYRTVDNNGVPTSGFTAVDTPYTFATRNPQRATIKIALTAARYEVRVSRLDAPASGSTVQNDVVWAGLRAFLQGPSSFPVSTAAIRIKANAQLTSASARKFGYLGTRILSVWNGTAFVDQATRNPIWAAYDAALNTVYGAAHLPSKIDFQTVVNLAAAADTRGDTFDYRFTTAVPVPEALDTILRVARCRHRWSGDVLTFVRDEWPSGGIPRMLLTDREIIRGSLNIDYVLNPDDAADAAVVEYIDQDIWNGAEIQYPANSVTFTATNPVRIRLPGIVQRAHAQREAAFYYYQSQLRRVNVTLDTEHDGRMLGFGSRVRVQTELPQSWGATGRVVSVANNTLTVDPAPAWTGTGSFYIAIRTNTGRQFGPVLCTQGTDATQVVLNATDLANVQTAQGMTLAQALTRQNGAEDPSFDFGAGTARARDCIVMTGRPSGDRVTLGLVVDNINVHTTSLTNLPALPALPSLIDPRTPIVAGLYAQFTQGVAEPMLDASWIPAAGAQYYVARVSYDGGTSWTQVYEGIASNFSRVPVDRAALRLQVQGVGVRHGPYAQVDLAAPVIQIAPGTVGIESLIAGLSDRVTNVLKQVDANNTAIAQFIASYGAEQDAHNFLDKVQSKQRDGTLKTLIDTTSGNLDAIGSRVTVAESTIVTNNNAFSAFATDVRANYATTVNVATADASTLSSANAHSDGAVASLNSSVTASLNGLTSSVNTNATAVATINGHLAASYAVKLDVNGYASGFRLLSDGTTANIAFAVDNFTVGTSGYASKSVFNIGTVGGLAQITIQGNLIADGTIVARAIAAGAVTATAVQANQVITAQANIQSATITTLHAVGESWTAIRNVVGADHVTGGVEDALLCGITKNITDGVVIVLASFHINKPARPWDLTMRIRVDGAVVEDRPLPIGVCDLNPGAGGQIAASAGGFFTAQVQVSGLSPGNHTFNLYLLNGDDFFGGNVKTTITCIVRKPTLTLFEAKR